MSNTVKQRPTQTERRARTRDRLFKATLEVIANRGVSGLTMRGVARTAGMTVGAIYANFENRDELLSSTLDWYHAHIDDLYMPEADSVRELLCGRMEQLLSTWMPSPDAPLLGALVAMQKELLASTDPAVCAVRDKWQTARRAAFAARIEEVAAVHGERLVVDSHRLAEQAIWLGDAFLRLPLGLVPNYVATAAVEALAHGAIAPPTDTR
jgi:AcrR family transcriptional regulator